ncbi:unnamed protein product [Victoria cruziana]
MNRMGILHFASILSVPKTNLRDRQALQRHLHSGFATSIPPSTGIPAFSHGQIHRTSGFSSTFVQPQRVSVKPPKSSAQKKIIASHSFLPFLGEGGQRRRRPSAFTPERDDLTGSSHNLHCDQGF